MYVVGGGGVWVYVGLGGKFRLMTNGLGFWGLGKRIGLRDSLAFCG